MEFPFEVRFLQVKRTGLKKLDEAQSDEYELLVTKIYSQADKLKKFISLYNGYHKTKQMNHTLFYFMKWRLFDAPPEKKNVELDSLYIDNYYDILFDSSKKYYDNINGLSSYFFSENSELKVDNIDLSKIDPILAYTIPANILGRLDKDNNGQVLEFSSDHPDAKKSLKSKLTKKKYLVRDGWKRTCLARIQGKKKINAYCFDYFNRGSKNDIYVSHEDLYQEAQKLIA